MTWIKERIENEYKKHKGLDWAALAEIKIISEINSIIDEELKYTTHRVVDGRAGKERIEAFKEGKEVGYNNGIDKIEKIRLLISGIKKEDKMETEQEFEEEETVDEDEESEDIDDEDDYD